MDPRSQVLTVQASVTQTTGADSTFVQSRHAAREAIFVLDVTAASGTTPTLDVFIDVSPDGGTSWLNIGHFAQMSAVGKTFLTLGATAQGTTGSYGLAGTDDCAAGTTRPVGVTDKIRSRSAIGGTTPSFTYSVIGYVKD